MQLSFALESEDRNTVFWIERRGRSFRREETLRHRSGQAPYREIERQGRQHVFVQATPIDVGPILRECLGRSWSARS